MAVLAPFLCVERFLQLGHLLRQFRNRGAKFCYDCKQFLLSFFVRHCRHLFQLRWLKYIAFPFSLQFFGGLLFFQHGFLTNAHFCSLSGARLNSYVFVKLLLLPHYHRGRAYYRQWKTQFGFRISDKICAVIFESGKPVFYYTQFGDIESQLETIVHAIQGKSQTNDAEKVVLGEKAVSFPMTVYRQEYDHWTHRILPDGAFTFGLNGIRYQHVGIISVLVSLTKYIFSRPIMKSEILYRGIYEVRLNKKARRIDLVTNSINGYYYLYPSRFLAVYLSDIAEYIEKCRSATENDAEIISLTERMMKIAETMERDSCLAAFI